MAFLIVDATFQVNVIDVLPVPQYADITQEFEGDTVIDEDLLAFIATDPNLPAGVVSDINDYISSPPFPPVEVPALGASLFEVSVGGWMNYLGPADTTPIPPTGNFVTMIADQVFDKGAPYLADPGGGGGTTASYLVAGTPAAPNITIPAGGMNLPLDTVVAPSALFAVSGDVITYLGPPTRFQVDFKMGGDINNNTRADIRSVLRHNGNTPADDRIHSEALSYHRNIATGETTQTGIDLIDVATSDTFQVFVENNTGPACQVVPQRCMIRFIEQ